MANYLKTLNDSEENAPLIILSAFKDYTWCNLPGAEQELANLKQLFKYKPILILRNKHASEAKLQSLNLDQLNKTKEADGYITTSEWVGYDLKSDLMFLSSCQTGRGKFVRGEGIMGLPYAFYVAGNKNTIMTLWNVKDKSTAEFTSKFFARLKQGMTQLEALTATKREFFYSKKYKRALFWAPFVLYGI